MKTIEIRELSADQISDELIKYKKRATQPSLSKIEWST